jgi:chromosome segregation ATPase
MKEYQTKGDQANREIQDLRNALEEKNVKEKQLNDSIDTLKRDLENLKTQITELEKQSLYFFLLSLRINRFYFLDQTKTNEFTEYQTKLDQLNQQNNQLRQQLEGKTKESDEKQNVSIHQSETLKKEFHELQTKYSDLQTECQKHLTSNEQLKNTNDNIVNEKQALIDQLTAQINDMQQVQAELIEKQIKQHADFEQQQTANQKIFKDKIENYEKEIQSMKSNSTLKEFRIFIDIF